MTVEHVNLGKGQAPSDAAQHKEPSTTQGKHGRSSLDRLCAVFQMEYIYRILCIMSFQLTHIRDISILNKPKLLAHNQCPGSVHAIH